MSLTVEIIKKYKDFTLDIRFDTQGKPLGLLGASGCGKSLTLKCIAGIEKPDKGRIVQNGRVLFDTEQGINLLPQQRNIGFMFQNYALFPNMTIRKNIEIVCRDKGNRKKMTDRMIEMFRLEQIQNRYPYQLSGGEQQRAALARIMVYQPEVMMLDEPFSALDVYLKDQLQQELIEVMQEYKGEILMVSHSRDELYRFCQNIAVINQGKMIELGSRADIFSSPTSIVTAKLSGCKNISRARKISDYEVEALDWDIVLRTEQYIGEDIRYIGIRAHNIKPDHGGQGINSIPVTQADISEGPFENYIMLYINNHISENKKLWWIVSKQDFHKSLEGILPDYITLPMEHILLLKDNY